nr:hypothetical protein [Desulforamulus aquiferis]
MAETADTEASAISTGLDVTTNSNGGGGSAPAVVEVPQTIAAPSSSRHPHRITLIPPPRAKSRFPARWTAKATSQ